MNKRNFGLYTLLFQGHFVTDVFFTIDVYNREEV